jgi:CubicO group peptidase (beta-lactamase class C family)
VEALHQIDDWDVPFATAGVTRAEATVATRGDTSHRVRLASVSKPVSALVALVAAEEGVLDLDEPAGPPGSTVRHLLAHTSGLPFEGEAPIAPPGRRRIYSNEGFKALGEHLAARAEMPFADYVRGAVVQPLALGLDPEGHPGAGMHASLEDVLALGRELLRRGSSPPRRTPRWCRSSSRGSTACCPTGAGTARSTGASASS